jgi:hypothetical protein
MASIFKPKGKAKYVILYTDENCRRRKKSGATDKTVTQRIARDLENRVALRREGLIDPAAETHANHEARPLADHLVDFRKALEAKGGTRKHALVTAHRAERVLTLARASFGPPGSGPRRSTTTSGRSRRSAVGSGETAAPGSMPWPTCPRAIPRRTAAAIAAP